MLCFESIWGLSLIKNYKITNSIFCSYDRLEKERENDHQNIINMGVRQRVNITIDSLHRNYGIRRYFCNGGCSKPHLPPLVVDVDFSDIYPQMASMVPSTLDIHFRLSFFRCCFADRLTDPKQ